MTTTYALGDKMKLIAPSDPNEGHFEHSIVVWHYEDAVLLVQEDRSITIPRYALSQVILAMRAKR